MAILSTDPIDMPIDPSTGDLTFTAGRVVLTAGLPAVVQGARIRIQMIAGEWFLDLDAGVRWFERVGVAASAAIFGQKFDQSKCDDEIRRAILAVPAVTTMQKLNSQFVGTTRGVSITWQAKTLFGDTPVDVIAVGA